MIELRLAVNELTELKLEYFTDQTTMEILDLNRNPITSIDPKLIQSHLFINLKELYLENEYFLNILKDNRTNNSTMFYLRNQNLNSINKKLFQLMPNVTFVYLESNRIKIIENKSFYDLKKLEQLHLSDNFLEQITENDFKGLINLKMLSIKRNSIEFIEDYSFSDLINLERLYLNDNMY